MALASLAIGSMGGRSDLNRMRSQGPDNTGGGGGPSIPDVANNIWGGAIPGAGPAGSGTVASTSGSSMLNLSQQTGGTLALIDGTFLNDATAANKTITAGNDAGSGINSGVAGAGTETRCGGLPVRYLATAQVRAEQPHRGTQHAQLSPGEYPERGIQPFQEDRNVPGPAPNSDMEDSAATGTAAFVPRKRQQVAPSMAHSPIAHDQPGRAGKDELTHAFRCTLRPLHDLKPGDRPPTSSR